MLAAKTAAKSVGEDRPPGFVKNSDAPKSESELAAEEADRSDAPLGREGRAFEGARSAPSAAR